MSGFSPKRSKTNILDVPEEVETHFVKVALAILEQEAHLKGLEGSYEIIEDISLRCQYKDKLQEELKITKAKTERLYRSVKSCIIRK